MVEPPPEIAQPMPWKVNPRKWTTKVNIAIVIAVVVVLLTGAIYAIGVALRRGDVDHGTPPPAAPATDQR